MASEVRDIFSQAFTPDENLGSGANERVRRVSPGGNQAERGIGFRKNKKLHRLEVEFG
jgi:hypothetical protein